MSSSRWVSKSASTKKKSCFHSAFVRKKRRRKKLISHWRQNAYCCAEWSKKKEGELTQKNYGRTDANKITNEIDWRAIKWDLKTFHSNKSSRRQCTYPKEREGEREREGGRAWEQERERERERRREGGREVERERERERERETVWCIWERGRGGK